LRLAAKLYSFSLSHPSQAVRLMLERKGIEHEVIDLLPGLHPVAVRAAGFRGGTVPALKFDGRKVQGSRRISRTLEELRPEPALFPTDPVRHEQAVEAERWGERVLQPVPRRIFRWCTAHSQAVRRWMVADVVGMPAPGPLAAVQAPLAWRFARTSGADDAAVRADVANLPALLGHVDELIAAGTIGGEGPNAADYQIATTVRVFLAFDDLRAAAAGRPAGALAARLLPSYPEPIPPALPPEWLKPLRAPQPG
jgi:glutathione S-transferase